MNPSRIYVNNGTEEPFTEIKILNISAKQGSDSSHIITPMLDFNGTLAVPVMVNDGAADSPLFFLSVNVSPGQ